MNTPSVTKKSADEALEPWLDIDPTNKEGARIICVLILKRFAPSKSFLFNFWDSMGRFLGSVGVDSSTMTISHYDTKG